MRQLPFLAVLAMVAVGLVAAGLDHWRAGAFLIGLALLLAAGLRLTLRERQAGFLVVRSRGFDAAVLLVLGFAVVTLANAIPKPTG